MAELVVYMVVTSDAYGGKYRSIFLTIEEVEDYCNRLNLPKASVQVDKYTFKDNEKIVDLMYEGHDYKLKK